MRVLHITDPHLFAEPTASLRGTVTHDSLTAVLEHVRDSGWPADVVAMTGDLIQDDSAGAYDRFRRLFEPLQLPVYCVPGNHDLRALMIDALSEAPFQYCGASVVGNWLIVGIDSCKRGSAAGHIADSELARLGQALAETDAAHALVCLHHPPMTLDSLWLDQVGLENRDEFLDLLHAHDIVRGCLFGHAHQQVEARHGSLTLIGTPSTCSQFLPGSDVFAIDDRPPAYRRVVLHADGAIESELIWLPQTQGVAA